LIFNMNFKRQQARADPRFFVAIDRGERFIMQRSFLFALGFMVMFGSLDNIKGLILPKLQEDLGLSYSQAGFILSSSNIGFLISSFLSGLLIDRLGIRRVLLFGVALFLLSLFGFGMSTAFIMLVLFFVASGLGAGSMEIGLNTLVPSLYPNQQSKFFNMLHGFYGIGGILSPVIVGWLLVHGVNWNQVYIGASIIVLVALAGLSRTKLPPSKTVEKIDFVELKGLLQNRLFLLYTFIIVVYIAAEVGLGAYLPVYLTEVRDLSIEQAALFLSLFFVTFSAGRIWGGIVVERLGDIRSLLIFSIIGVLVLGMGQLSLAWTVWLFPVSGLFFSILFPTMASMVSRTFPRRIGTALGFLFAAAGTGAMLSVWLIGVAADIWGVALSFSVTMWLLLIVSAGAALLRRWVPISL
jgi:fucose permease